MTRYEFIVQARCLLEGVSKWDILSDWETILAEHMARWDLKRENVRLGEWLTALLERSGG